MKKKKQDDVLQINSNQEEVSNENIEMQILILRSGKKHDEMLDIPIKTR